MNTEINEFYRHIYACINCNTSFQFDYKNDLIEKATCPVCEQSNPKPINVLKIQEIKVK